MKSEMPYLGVQAPALRAVCRRSLAHIRWRHTGDGATPYWRSGDARTTSKSVTRQSDLSGCRQCREFHTLENLPCYEEMVTDGAWWDYVDAVP